MILSESAAIDHAGFDFSRTSCSCQRALLASSIYLYWTSMFRRSPSIRSHDWLRPSRYHCIRQKPCRRTLIDAPRPNQGPLMFRRPDRELPEIPSSSLRWLRTLPIFLVIMAASTLAIFNYQKASSSIVNATLYALRTSPQARELLGDEIYFRDKFPWIWGEMNQLHGKINIEFGVKGTRAKGLMRFKSTRKTRMGYVSDRSFFKSPEDSQK